MEAVLVFCRNCGQPHPEQAIFCSHCGNQLRHSGLSPTLPANAFKQADAGKRPHQILMRLGIILTIVVVLGLAAWQLAMRTGVLRQLAVGRAAANWRNQEDFASVETEILSSLQEMAEDLENGQLDLALSRVHPDQQATYRNQLTESPAKAADFAQALKSAKVVYLSSDAGNYESERMALIAASLPVEQLDRKEDAPIFTMVLVWYEERWVIDS